MAYLSLESLMLEPRPMDWPLTTDTGKVWRDLLCEISGFEQALRIQAKGSSWLLLCPTPSVFVAGLLACWRQGLVPVIAPDAEGVLPEGLSRRIAGIVCEVQGVAPDWEGTRIVRSPCAELAQPAALDGARLELFTSGSSGERKAVIKTLGQLARELDAQRGFWGEGGRCVSTVSHFHIYGLLFRLLAPLCAGQAFPDKTPFHLDELLAELNQPGPIRLSSSPTHLRLLAQALTLKSANPGAAAPSTAAPGAAAPGFPPIQIFSSGAPLGRETAHQLAHSLGAAPFEVLGSTETGGIAWRTQFPGGTDAWCALPGVEVKFDERGLLVRSPWFSANPDADWWPTGDSAEPVLDSPSEFRLLGRSDQLVKLAGKRIAFAEIERRLLEHPTIARVRIVAFPPHAGRERLGALLQLTPLGEGDWLALGSKALFHEWRQWLAPLFPPLAWPKVWRICTRFPVDSQGKTSLAAVLEQLHAPQLRLTPLLLTRRVEPDKLCLDLQVSADFYYFQGHFPALPVVAGVCQLKWVQDALLHWLREPMVLREMEAVKFRELLLADAVFTLELARGNEQRRFHFRIFSPTQVYASGRLYFD